MEADIEWNVLFLSLEGSSLVVVFFVFVDMTSDSTDRKSVESEVI